MLGHQGSKTTDVWAGQILGFDLVCKCSEWQRKLEWGKGSQDGKAVELGVTLAQTLLVLNKVSGVALQPSCSGCSGWFFWCSINQSHGLDFC